MSWSKQRNVKKFSVPIKKEITKIDKDGNEGVIYNQQMIHF